MPKMRDLRVVGADYALTGPHSTTVKQSFTKPAESVFAALTDAAAWKEWLNIDIEWTSKRPFGVGTTRIFKASGQTIDEVFTFWEEPKRVAFYFARASLPLVAFAENYTLTPTGPNSCELTWSFAYEWGGILPGIIGRIFGLFTKYNGRKILKKFAEKLASTDRYDKS